MATLAFLAVAALGLFCLALTLWIAAAGRWPRRDGFR